MEYAKHSEHHDNQSDLLMHTNQSMLQTKITIPFQCEKLLKRERIKQLLNRGLNYKLTLICTPPLYGKTTALKEFAESITTVNWLVIDKDDNDEKQFWISFILSLKYLNVKIRNRLLAQLSSVQQPLYKDIVMSIINELSVEPSDIVVVFDEFHHIDNEKIIESFNYFLMYLPKNVHVFVASRTMPSFSIAQFRAKGEMVEVTTSDLRFSTEEVRLLLKDKFQVAITCADINRIYSTYEGWIGGIILGIKPMIQDQGNEKLKLTNKSFSNKYINEFFLHEIFQQQPEYVKNLLLKLSIFKTFHADILEGALEIGDGKALLTYLESLNVFIHPLGDWPNDSYRFHPLIRRILLEEFKRQDSEVKRLHLKASDWYLSHNQLEEGIVHLLEAEEFQLAAQVFEENTHRIFQMVEIDMIIDWLKLLPEKEIDKRPLLLIYKIHFLLFNGENMRAAQSLNLLKSLMKEQRVDQKLMYEILMIEASMSLLQNDEKAMDLHIKACNYCIESKINIHSLQWFNNNQPSLLQSVIGMKGNVNKAADFYMQILKKIGKERLRVSPYKYSYLLLSEVNYERNDLDRAMEYYRLASSVGSCEENIQFYVPLQMNFSNIELALGNYYSALEIMKQLKRAVNKTSFTNWIPMIDAQIAKINVKMGKIKEAFKWKSALDLQYKEVIHPNNIFEYMILAQVFITNKKLEDAQLLLERVLPTVETVCGTGVQIKAYIFLALCYDLRENKRCAYFHLRKALLLGEELGYRRIFLEEGAALKRLLQKYERCKDVPNKQFIETLLQQFQKEIFLQMDNEKQEESTNNQVILTARELEVLTVLCEGRSNQEISKQLFISVITVKVHLKHIYKKLGVKNRSQAILRSKELKLT